MQLEFNCTDTHMLHSPLSNRFIDPGQMYIDYDMITIDYSKYQQYQEKRLERMRCKVKLTAHL